MYDTASILDEKQTNIQLAWVFVDSVDVKSNEFMNMHSLHRRQFLVYFGLAAGTTALSVGCQQAKTNQPSSQQTTASNNQVKSSTPQEKPTKAMAVASTDTTSSLPDFQGISQWLNSGPLKIDDLKGKVVLVQFWTFACINCQRTLPYITRWHRQYAAQGLQVVGVHTPELPYERDVNNVRSALKQHQITYPVPIDNEYKTWNAYKNEYWPHLFLADRQGVFRYDHIGEGAYEETEQMIRKLLG